MGVRGEEISPRAEAPKAPETMLMDGAVPPRSTDGGAARRHRGPTTRRRPCSGARARASHLAHGFACYVPAMEPRTDLWLQNLLHERDGAALYEGLAKVERDPERARLYSELAAAERRHAEIWARKLEKAGATLPPERPSSRIRALIWLARRLGTAAVLPLVLENEGNDAAEDQK